MTDPVVLLSTGDVIGPNSATDGTMVLFDGTSGKKVKGNNAVVTAQGLSLLDDVDAAANRATIGLNLVNNTSDLNKPISIAQQTALDTKQATLGYTPVQQGGGIGQTGTTQNKVFLGYGTNARLKVTVDSTDLGNVVFDSTTAQEAVPGVIKLATIAEVQGGAETLKAVTPKNLRMGFYVYLGYAGYIVFPTWLGSFMFQWGGYSLPAATGAQVTVNYPIPFGTVLRAWAGVDGSATDQIGTQSLTASNMLVCKGSADTSARTGSWFAIGGAF